MSLLLPLILATAAVRAVQPITVPHPADPFADPANDPYNPLRYIPNNALTSVATGTSRQAVRFSHTHLRAALVAAVAVAQVWLTIKFHIKWMLVMTLGCFSPSSRTAHRACALTLLRDSVRVRPGGAIRARSQSGVKAYLHHRIPLRRAFREFSQSIAVPAEARCQPCAFIAASYMVLGRLARYLKADAYLLIRPTRVTLVFVLSDVVTFLIQVRGTGVNVP